MTKLKKAKQKSSKETEILEYFEHLSARLEQVEAALKALQSKRNT